MRRSVRRSGRWSVWRRSGRLACRLYGHGSSLAAPKGVRHVDRRRFDLSLRNSRAGREPTPAVQARPPAAATSDRELDRIRRRLDTSRPDRVLREARRALEALGLLRTLGLRTKRALDARIRELHHASQAPATRAGTHGLSQTSLWTFGVLRRGPPACRCAGRRFVFAPTVLLCAPKRETKFQMAFFPPVILGDSVG